jgi:hypothetical protein
MDVNNPPQFLQNQFHQNAAMTMKKIRKPRMAAMHIGNKFTPEKAAIAYEVAKKVYCKEYSNTTILTSTFHVICEHCMPLFVLTIKTKQSVAAVEL